VLGIAGTSLLSPFGVWAACRSWVSVGVMSTGTRAVNAQSPIRL